MGIWWLELYEVVLFKVWFLVRGLKVSCWFLVSVDIESKCLEVFERVILCFLRLIIKKFGFTFCLDLGRFGFKK